MKNGVFLFLLSLTTLLPGCASKRNIATMLSQLDQELSLVGRGYHATVSTDIEVIADTILPAQTGQVFFDPDAITGLEPVKSSDSNFTVSFYYDTLDGVYRASIYQPPKRIVITKWLRIGTGFDVPARAKDVRN